MQHNLYALFESCFSQSIENTFIQLKDKQTFSYADMDAYSSRLANRMIEFGIRPGDRIISQIEKSPIAVFLYLACLKSGVIFIPLNTAYQKEELEYLCNDALPKIIICSPNSPIIANSFNVPNESTVFTMDGAGEGSFTDNLYLLSSDFETIESNANDVAAILYTSGTTGKPKGAMLTHGNLASNAKALHTLWGFHDDDVLLHALPIFHTHGLFVAINTTLLNGSKMIFLPRFNVDDVFDLLPEVSVMMGVPAFYNRLLKNCRFGKNTSKSIRLFISGSAPLSNEIFSEFKQRTGLSILERYGMTETNMITSNPLNGDRIAGSVGYPLPGVEIRICGTDGQNLQDGQPGDIEVRGANVFKGYWQNPEKTKAEFHDDGFFKTGDVGYVESDGRLFIVGRSKDLIISGGLNVYPSEVESVLNRVEGIEEAAVIGVPHLDFGEGVIAIVVSSQSNSSQLSESSVIEEARYQLAGFKVPKKVFFCSNLPRNAMGKVEKAKLREIHREVFTQAG